MYRISDNICCWVQQCVNPIYKMTRVIVFISPDLVPYLLMNNHKVYNYKSLLSKLFDLPIRIRKGNLGGIRGGTTTSVLGPRESWPNVHS